MQIYLAVPSLDGMIHGGLSMWITKQVIKYDIIFDLLIKVIPHDSARNLAVKGFLQSDADYLLFIDNDVVPPDNALDVLINADKDIIAPICFGLKADDNGLPFPLIVSHRFNKEMGGLRPHYGKGIEEVDAITGGMFLIKREVVKQLPKPLFKFTYDEYGVTEHSEDFMFAKLAQSKGYKLYTHYDIVCDHYQNGVSLKKWNNLLCNIDKNNGK